MNICQAKDNFVRTLTSVYFQQFISQIIMALGGELSKVIGTSSKISNVKVSNFDGNLLGDNYKAELDKYRENNGLESFYSGSYENITNIIESSIEHKDKKIIVGNRLFLACHNINANEASEVGTIVYLGVNNQYVGYALLSDELKKDAQPMVNLLHYAGVEIVLLTGDKEEIACEIAQELSIKEYHSELMPEDKLKYNQIFLDLLKKWEKYKVDIEKLKSNPNFQRSQSVNTKDDNREDNERV